MLIITRRCGETFEIGNDVKVMILGIKGMQVRVGIDAPKNIAVHRSEVAVKVRAENAGVIPGKDVGQ
jgi:carbon storage regulator